MPPSSDVGKAHAGHAAGASPRPIYFTVAFWGRVYREYFTDLLLASLLAPHNIPALNPARGSRLLIATTRDDWEALRRHPLMIQARAYVDTVWLPFEPGADAHLNDRKMGAMSRGQAMLATRAFDDRAYGMYLTPDAMFADGSIAALERLVETGRKVVFAIAVRFQYEGAIAELRRRGHLAPGRPLCVAPRDLMRIVLRHLHSETLRYEFDAPWFADVPISPFWRVPGDEGVLFHTFSWAPLIVDYAALGAHDISTFENWTLDGDYVYRNFPDAKDVYVVTDSDEVAYVSFTKEADLHFELRPELHRHPAWLVTWYKTQLIRRLKDSDVMDPLKRDIFPTPVYFHHCDRSAAWARTRARARRTIAAVYARPGGRQRLAELCAALRAPGLAARIGPVSPVTRNAVWSFKYRRFLWQRAKEKIGWSRGRSRVDDGRDWISPTLGLMNPLWTAVMVARDRRYTAAASGLIRAWLSRRAPVRWALQGRWCWRYRRYLWQRLKERNGWTPGRSRLDDGRDWVSPALGVMNPVWSAIAVLRDGHARAAAARVVKGWGARHLLRRRRGMNAPSVHTDPLSGRDAAGRLS